MLIQLLEITIWLSKRKDLGSTQREKEQFALINQVFGMAASLLNILESSMNLGDGTIAKISLNS